MKLVIKRDAQTIDGVEEIEIKAPPAWLPEGTHTIQKVLGNFQAYDWGLSKLGQITEAQVEELEALALPKRDAGYRIPTAEENDQWWEGDEE